eukprot:jgi/Psemu1/45230/gm1.45230_g
MKRKISTQHYMDPASFAEVIKINKEDMAHSKKSSKNNISNRKNTDAWNSFWKETATPQSAYKRKVLKPMFLLDSAEYCARSNELNHGNGKDERNPFLYHFETGSEDALCAKNGHLVLTILNGCNKINNVRARLNSQKGCFNEKEGLEIWEQCLKYVTDELFPFCEEGNTGGVDHMWAMGGIIMTYVLCDYPALKGTEDIQCYNNMGIGQLVQSGEQERLKLNGHTFPPKQWCNLTPETRKHIKECIHFNLGNHPCLTSLWFNEGRTMTEEAIIEKYRIMYIEETDDSKKKNQKLKQLANKQKREEEDGNKRNIVHWLHLYKKRWKSTEDLEEYNNYPVPCGAWGREYKKKMSGGQFWRESQLSLCGIAEVKMNSNVIAEVKVNSNDKDIENEQVESVNPKVGKESTNILHKDPQYNNEYDNVPLIRLSNQL